MQSLFKKLFFICLYSLFLLLPACSDGVRQNAPVIDAWYQPHAASRFYVVRQSDTIYSIAFVFGLDYRDLVAANHLQPPYQLTVGQRLQMTHRPPAIAHPPAPRPIPSAFTTTPLRHPPVSRPLRWHWPVRGRVFRYFSTNPSGHPGISITGYLGEPVRASASGTVVYSGDGVRGYGNLIIIKHTDSYLSAYAFNQYNLVMVGDRVQAGTVIARMGHNDAGRTLLYFEVRRDGVPMNPLLFLK